MNERSILIIDDDPHVRGSLKQMLELEDYRAHCLTNAKQALGELSPQWHGVIVSDVNMPGMDGIEFLKRALAIDKDIPIVLLTGYGDVSMAVSAMRIGAYDFLEKPFSNEHLLDVLNRAYDKRKLVLENRELREELAMQSAPGPRILGRNPQIQRLRRMLVRIKDIPADVLIRGETGTGKDMAARFLHDHGLRREKPFVAINCGAIPEALIESELFGYEAGAFTGAQRKRIGKIVHANGGTLFLDEIDSMPEALQVKLLRVLENRKVEPLGGNQPIDLDIRILAASKQDLKSFCERGKFRMDLYYRLNVVDIYLPPLRKRIEDIPLLFENFVRIASARYQIEPRQPNAEQLLRLQQHNWPGNVRELRNVAERFVLMGNDEVFLQFEDHNVEAGGLTLAEQVSRFEFTMLQATLERHRGILKEVQRELGLPRKTLYEKMKKYGLNKGDYKWKM